MSSKGFALTPFFSEDIRHHVVDERSTAAPIDRHESVCLLGYRAAEVSDNGKKYIFILEYSTIILCWGLYLSRIFLY